MEENVLMKDDQTTILETHVCCFAVFSKLSMFVFQNSKINNNSNQFSISFVQNVRKVHVHVLFPRPHTPWEPSSGRYPHVGTGDMYTSPPFGVMFSFLFLKKCVQLKNENWKDVMFAWDPSHHITQWSRVKLGTCTKRHAPTGMLSTIPIDRKKQ